LPAMLIIMVIAWVYVRYGTLPQVAGMLYGIKPVIIAVVLQALWRLGCSAAKTVPLGLLAAVVAALNFMGAGELLLLFGAGALMAIVRAIRRRAGSLPCVVPLVGTAAAPAAVAAVSSTAVPFTLGGLMLSFMK